MADVNYGQTKNFQVSTVATAPSPATSGTSLVVAAGEGARFDTNVPFNAVVAPADAQPTSANSEVVRITAKSTDTLTITRATESSNARSIIVGDRIYVGPTAKVFTDIAADFTSVLTAIGARVNSALADAKGDMWAASAADTPARVPAASVNGHAAVADSAQSAGVKFSGQLDRDYGQAGMYAGTHIFGTSATALTSDRLYCSRFVPSRDMTITAMSFYVSTASGSNDAVNLGIGRGTATATITIDKTSGSTTPGVNSTGVKSVNLSSSLALTAGTVYYAIFTATSTATITMINYPSTGSCHLFGSNLTSGAEGMFKASVTPAGLGTTTQTSVSSVPATVPLLALKE